MQSTNNKKAESVNNLVVGDVGLTPTKSDRIYPQQNMLMMPHSHNTNNHLQAPMSQAGGVVKCDDMFCLEESVNLSSTET